MLNSLTYLILFAFLFSTATTNANTYYQDKISLTQNQTERFQAAAGEIWARFDSTDDIYLAAGKIDFSGVTTENMFMAAADMIINKTQARLFTGAGGNITITNTEVKDLLLAGGNLKLDNIKVNDDVTFAGGQVDLGADIKVSGSVVGAGGQIKLEGKYAEKVLLFADTVTLTGQFDKDIKVYTNKLYVKPGTTIKGNLSYYATLVDISPDAQITNKIILEPYFKSESQRSKTYQSIWFFLVLLGSFLVPVLVTLLWRRPVILSYESIRSRYWENLGKGLAVILLVPVTFIILLISVIGLPFAFASLPFIFVLHILSCAIAVFSLGQLLISKFQKGDKSNSTKSLFFTTLIGTVVMYLLMLIPLIGFIIASLLFLASVGAAITLLKDYVKKSQS